ncbi:hypothetical protein MRB53_009778 [Persea americana]|uniref:Uncharacterized protein n=1 Tax=Persea americana TaxID=3435 RepID=A0ACC2LR56_PERAE|nr:hypothetical protein MRB53_009778 [Persea americana]
MKYEAFNVAVSTQSDALSSEDLYGEHLVQESELEQLHMAFKVQPLLLWTLLLGAEVALDLGAGLGNYRYNDGHQSTKEVMADALRDCPRVPAHDRILQGELSKTRNKVQLCNRTSEQPNFQQSDTNNGQSNSSWASDQKPWPDPVQSSHQQFNVSAAFIFGDTASAGTPILTSSMNLPRQHHRDCFMMSTTLSHSKVASPLKQTLPKQSPEQARTPKHKKSKKIAIMLRPSHQKGFKVN